MNDGSNGLRRFFAWLLMAIGILIGGSAGLCTLGFMAVFLRDAFAGGDAVGAIVTPLLFGGVPILVGAGLVVAGWQLRPSRRPTGARSEPET